MDDEELARKWNIFQARKSTTHWPVSVQFHPGPGKLTDTQEFQQQNVVPADMTNNHFAIPRRPDDSPDPANRTRPFVEPQETPMMLKLAGFRA